jgi:hypothetical protein
VETLTTNRLTRRNVVAALVIAAIISVGVVAVATSTKPSNPLSTIITSTNGHATTIFISATSTGATNIVTNTASTTGSISSSSALTLGSTSSVTTIGAQSVNNTCFIQNYNSSINTISSAYYECSATLNGDQSIKQFVLRSTQLYGSFTVSINASQSISELVVENGAVVYIESGTSNKYSGTIPQGELMSITITNSASSLTTYELGIDWTSV